MKKQIITILSIAAFTSPLFAQGEAKEGKQRAPRGERPDISALTDAEKVTFLKKRMEENPKMAEMFAKRFDTDENGSLSDAELLAAAEKMANRKGGKDGEGKGKGKGKRGERPEAAEGEERPERAARGDRRGRGSREGRKR